MSVPQYALPAPPCGSRTFCILCGACRLCDQDQPCYDHDGSETWPHHWKTDKPLSATSQESEGGQDVR